jgi:hypothetical protein
MCSWQVRFLPLMIQQRMFALMSTLVPVLPAGAGRNYVELQNGAAVVIGGTKKPISAMSDIIGTIT